MHSVPTIEFEEHRLGNGLQVLFHADRRIPLVHLTLHYRVGSSYEWAGASGLAHLFEHMMFQGSENVPKNAHGRYIDAAGGIWNASTNKDRTNYYETLPSNALELALWLEAERMRSLAITPQKFENQRQTVIEEKKQSYDNRPYGLAQLRFDELAYTNWAYAHPIIGSVEDLARLTLRDALDFHGRYYGPGNATMVLSGDIPPDALGKVESHFGPIADRTHPEIPSLDEPEQREEKTETVEDPLAILPAVYMGYHMRELGSPEYYALSILALVISQRESSRFYRRLVYENNWVSSLSAGPNQYKGPELFIVWCQLQDGVLPETVIDAVEGELDQILRDGIRPEELDKARNQVAFRFVSRLRTVAQVGEALARSATYFDDPAIVNKELRLYLAVTREQVVEAARAALSSENRALLVVRPGRSAWQASGGRRSRDRSQEA